MKKQFLWLITLILLVSFTSSEVDNSLFDANSILLDFTMTNRFSIIPSNPSYNIDSITSNLYWYPIDDYRQHSDSITTSPKSDFVNNKSYEFNWQHPNVLKFEMVESSKILLEKKSFQINKEISFPLQNIPQSYSSFLKFGEITDSNEDIKNLASQIASGKNDELEVIYDLALWVENNVQYDLSTLTADASQKSSWVLDNRKGVCDELTSLFISMSRSVGIPARFVSGISYSNVNLENDGWGPHGWAEVYVPNYGWMPVDVTYRQIGYVDSTHIKLSAEQDAKSSSVEYSTYGKNINIKSGSLDFKVNILKRTTSTKPLLDMKLDVDKSQVGFGSYELAVLTITNNNDYYVFENIRFSNVTDLDIEQSLTIPIILKPKQSKKYYWLIKTPIYFDRNYIYTFPLIVKGDFGEYVDSSFEMQRNFEIYSKDYMNSKIPALEKIRSLSNSLKINCQANPSELYQNDMSKIKCIVNNEANSQIKNAKVCLEKNCTIESFDANSQNVFEYEYLASNIGSSTLTFSVDSISAFGAKYVTLLSKDEPSVLIQDIKNPYNISFEDNSEIKILLERTSNSYPVNAKLHLIHKILDQTWPIQMQKERNELRYVLSGSDLQEGKNDFKVILTYEDDKGKTYSETKNFSIILNEPTFGQKILLWINMIDYKINKFIESV